MEEMPRKSAAELEAECLRLQELKNAPWCSGWNLSSIFRGSGQRPEGKCKNDVSDAFGFLSDASPQILVGDEVQESFLQIVRASRGALLRIGGRSETADISIRHPVNLTGRRSDQPIGRRF